MFTLQQQVDETKTESEYQLRLKDNKYAEEARILKKKFNADISDLKQVSMVFFPVKSISRNFCIFTYCRNFRINDSEASDDFKSLSKREVLRRS